MLQTEISEGFTLTQTADGVAQQREILRRKSAEAF